MQNRESRPNFKGEGCVRLAVNARLTLLHCSPQFFAWLIFFSTVLIRFSWINSIHSDDKGCVRLAVTTWLTDFLSNTLILMAGDTSLWRSSCNWQFHITLLHVVLHWFVLIWFSWFHSIIAGNFDGKEMGSTDSLTLFSYSCYVCPRNFLLGVNLCLKTQS